MGTLTHSIARKKSKTLFTFLTRDSDGAVYDTTVSSFIEGLALHLVSANIDRAKYRVPYSEVYAGMYRLEVECSNFVDSTYTLDSRYLNGEVESLSTDKVSLKVSSGEVLDGDLDIQASLSAGLTLFCYIRDTFTSHYLQTDMIGFKNFSPLDDAEITRQLFRHTFTPNGTEYSLSRSLASIPDTVLEVSIYNLRETEGQNVEYKAGLPLKIHVLNGKQQRGVLFDEILLNHDTKTNDNLRYVAPNGDPIAEAEVYVFRKSDYTSDSLDNALGRTLTNTQGRWVAPVPVQAGVTYTILFFKGSTYGPDTAEVSV